MLTQIGELLVAWNDNMFHGLMSFWPLRIDSFQTKNEHGNTVALEIKKEEAEPQTPEALLSDVQNGFFSTRIYQLENGTYCFQYVRTKRKQLLIELIVDSDFCSICITHDSSATNGMQVYEYIGQIVPYALLNKKNIVFHGVLLEYMGKTFIISADSGVGKTTHARLWRDTENALILNGDLAAVCKSGDQWYGYGLPWSGSSGEQINRKAPLAAFVKLERGTANETEIIRGLDAFMAMYANCRYPEWNKEYSEKAVDIISDLIEDIPVIRLKCLPDADSVQVLKKRLESMEVNYE